MSTAFAIINFELEVPLTFTTITRFYAVKFHRANEMIRFFLILMMTVFLFSSCKLSMEGKKSKSPDTRDEKLSFYRSQIVGLEAEIDYHFKHRMDFNLKSDYSKLEEILKGLSSLLEKPEQETIVAIIEDMNKAIINFNKTRSFIFFSRANDSIFAKLRKVKKVILKKEKTKVPEKEEVKKEAPKSEDAPIKEENTGKEK